MNEKIKIIRQHGKTARGQKEILKHLSGQKLTFKQAIYAKCYDCMNYFSDGKIDCKIPSCPLYPFMAYKENREKKSTKTHKTGEYVQTRAAMLSKSILTL